MTLYLGLIHKDDDTGYGVSFPDLPGHVTAGDTLDEAFERVHELIHLLHRHWREDTGENMPSGRGYQDVKEALKGSDLLEDAIFIAISTDHPPTSSQPNSRSPYLTASLISIRRCSLLSAFVTTISMSSKPE